MELRDQNKKTEYGSIPKDWTIKSLNLEIDLLTGFPFPSSHYSRNGVRLLRGSNVKRGVTDWNPEITQYWPKVTPDLKEYLMNEGDIVVAMDGSLVGKSFARLSRNDVPSLLLQRVARIRSTKIDLGYLKEFVCSDYFTKYCDTVKTSSAIPHISPSDIRNFRIPVPPTKSEQTAIASALSDADALIASLEKLIAKKRLIKQGVMQKLLEPKEGWKLARLGDVVTLSRSSINPLRHQNEQFVLLSIPAFDNDKIPEVVFGREVASQKNLVPPASILVSKLNPRIPRVWMPDFQSSQRLICSTEFLVFVPHDKSIRSFLYTYFQHSKFSEQMELGATGTTGSHQRMNPTDSLNIEIAFPIDHAERNVIVETVTDIQNEIDAIQKRIEKTKIIKQGMMQTLLTGKIRLV